MVRLIYAAMALALGALVTGFFVNTSSAPLLASIVLSAAVMLLILFGWSRRIRQGMDLYSGEESGSEAVTDIGDAEIEVVELEPDEFRAPKAKPKPAALRRRAAERAAAISAASAAESDSTAVLPTSTGRAARTAKARPGAKPKPRPAAAGKARPAPKPKPPAPARRTPGKKTPARSAKSPTRTAAKAKKSSPAARGSRSKASPGRASRAEPKGKPKTKPKTKKVLVIPGRSKYHRRGCRFAKGDDVREVSESTARNRGYEPCNVCSP